MSIFIGQIEYSVLDLGFDKSLTKALLGLQGEITPELVNVFSGGTTPRTLIAGELISSIEQQSGAVFSGKTGFNNTNAGYRLGIDTDGVAKFYIGNTTDYFNWDGINVKMSGTFSAGAITIGTNAWHVDTSGNMWWGSSATYAGATIKISSAGSVDFTTGTFSGTLSAAGGTLGTLEITSTGHIRGGQTAYNTGTGFFLGYSTDAYKFSIGNTAGDYMIWSGSVLTIFGSLKPKLVVSDVLIQSADTGQNVTVLTYTKLKEILVQFGGNIRVKFQLSAGGGGNETYGKIYKNGSAIGTERMTTVGPTTYSEDFSGIITGDLIQLYCKYAVASPFGSASNFRIYGSILDSTVNLD